MLFLWPHIPDIETEFSEARKHGFPAMKPGSNLWHLDSQLHFA